MSLLPLDPPGVDEPTAVPEVKSAWSRVRRLLTAAFVWCPVLVVMLSAVAVIPVWVSSGGREWSWIPAVGAAVIAAVGALWIRRNSTVNPDRWPSTSFLLMVVQSMFGLIGATVVVGASLDDSELTWILGAASLGAVAAVLTGSALAFSAMRTIRPPSSAAWCAR